ncbi:TetR/AcrR family transcriptional regulator [Ornithinimicrobium avium]|uniref:WHG domain-containing protein n=1 Tax=Ornithinimicrobium avium TaxID=2283195 RepID=A0A345NLK2_9MICO|nr:TetR-like C-terminal domain-containing protein [Ornithinimicrobium avium]AXH95910.1 WHG domain-containing protein [Ornithinimicrobium avium]
MVHAPAPYHHGDLPQAILAAAATAVGRDGVAALSLRSLAQEVGVSHTAPRHHFGDKRGVVTALAAQGYDDLALALRRAGSGGTFLDVGVAYVGWALDHGAHYQVMFRPELVDTADPAHEAALGGLRHALVESLDGTVPTPDGGNGIPVLGLAAWSIVHGFVTLALADSLPLPPGDRRAATLALARSTLARLDTTPGTTEPATPEG